MVIAASYRWHNDDRVRQFYPPEGDKRAALELVPEGKLPCKSHLGGKNAGVDTFSMNRRVSDLATIYALYAGGRGYIHINVDTETNESETGEEEYDTALTPNFLSGLVFNGIADVAEKMVKFRVLRFGNLTLPAQELAN